MSDPAPLPYGRDSLGRFMAGNTAGQGRPHAFARQAAALRQAFFTEVTPADMRALVRKLVQEATGGNLQAARLVLLWIVGRPADPHHPDAVETMEAAELANMRQGARTDLRPSANVPEVSQAEAAPGNSLNLGNKPISQTQAAASPPPLPADRAARERLAVRLLAEEIRESRRLGPEPGAVVETALEDLDTPF